MQSRILHNNGELEADCDCEAHYCFYQKSIENGGGKQPHSNFGQLGVFLFAFRRSARSSHRHGVRFFRCGRQFFAVRHAVGTRRRAFAHRIRGDRRFQRRYLYSHRHFALLFFETLFLYAERRGSHLRRVEKKKLPLDQSFRIFGDVSRIPRIFTGGRGDSAQQKAGIAFVFRRGEYRIGKNLT